MDRDQLQGYLSQGLSLEQIGILVNRDPSTVGYWLSKHGLSANGKEKHAPRGGLTREQLEPLVRSGATLAEMASELERSTSTVRHWLKAFDLKTQNGRGPRPKAAPGPSEVVLTCPRHGATAHVLRRSEQAYRCKRCRSEAVSRWRRKVKALLVKEAGGKCALCGYHRCIAALEFHHRDPSTKSFGVARKGATRRLDLLRAEASKCVLLCGNCHAEVEAGFTDLTAR